MTHSPKKNNADNDDDEETILSAEEERALMAARPDDAALASSSSSESSSSNKAASSSTSWNVAVRSSSSSSGSSSGSASSSSSSSSSSCDVIHAQRRPDLYRALVVDATSDLRQLFASASGALPSLLAEKGVAIETVTLHSYDAATSGWRSRRAVVAVSERPFALGGMRAAFFLADLTPQLARDILVSLRASCAAQAQQQQQQRAALGSGGDALTAFALLGKNRYSLDVSLPVLDALLLQESAAGAPPVETCYVAKAYKRFLVRKSDRGCDDAREEMLRMFRDAHLQATAGWWAEQMNSRRAAPRIGFLPVWVLQRDRVPRQGTDKQESAAAAASAATAAGAALPPGVTVASSRQATFLSLEPLLRFDGDRGGGGDESCSQFVKINNNNGWTNKRHPCSLPPTADPKLLASVSMLEREVFAAGAALPHFSYVMSKRTLLVCDVQGSLAAGMFSDPQIHTITAQGFGTGNLGPRCIFTCLRAHTCNAVCRKLGLPPLDMEAERVYLQEQHRRVRSGEVFKHGDAQAVFAVQVPPAAMQATVNLDFDF